MNKPEEAESFRRIEVITGVARRRRWPEEVRARILAESFEEGANVSAVARRYGAAPSQVFGWRKAALAQAAAAQTKTAIFAPVVVEERQTHLRAAEPSCVIEVEIGEAKLRIPANAKREAILAVMEGLGSLTRRR